MRNYKINIPGKSVFEGYYNASGSYVGASEKYFFANAKYLIRRKYESDSFGIKHFARTGPYVMLCHVFTALPMVIN